MTFARLFLIFAAACLCAVPGAIAGPITSEEEYADGIFTASDDHHVTTMTEKEIGTGDIFENSDYGVEKMSGDRIHAESDDEAVEHPLVNAEGDNAIANDKGDDLMLAEDGMYISYFMHTSSYEINLAVCM